MKFPNCQLLNKFYKKQKKYFFLISLIDVEQFVLIRRREVSSYNGNSIIRFCVDAYESTDDNDTSDTVVPFQVSYAISIHKAQDLEYDSVKIVITDEIGELITHNIFIQQLLELKTI